MKFKKEKSVQKRVDKRKKKSESLIVKKRCWKVKGNKKNECLILKRNVEKIEREKCVLNFEKKYVKKV